MKKLITDLNLNDKKVLIRLDLNVPLKGKKITSLKRIEESIPTIKYVQERGGKIILLSHLGRVKTKEDKEKKSLSIVVEALASLLNSPVKFVDQTRGKKLESAIEKLKPGDVLLIENTRFEDLNNNAESNNDPELGKYWASLGDVFINDAFGTAHRAHASNVGIASNIKESALGILVQKEVNALWKLMEQQEKPFVAILGGSKVSDKINVLEKIIDKVDRLIIGGAMAYTFLKAQGIGIGDSIYEQDKIEFATEFLKKYNHKIILPIDHALAKKFKNAKPIFNNENPLEIPQTFIGMDVGPKTIELIHKYIKGDTKLGISPAKTIFWNGPMGVTEFEEFQSGSLAVVEAISQLVGAYSVVGGGDSIAIIEKLNAQMLFSHISTGGGASLEFIESKVLPGIDAIQNYEQTYEQYDSQVQSQDFSQNFDSPLVEETFSQSTSENFSDFASSTQEHFATSENQNTLINNYENPGFDSQDMFKTEEQNDSTSSFLTSTNPFSSEFSNEFKTSDFQDLKQTQETETQETLIPHTFEYTTDDLRHTLEQYVRETSFQTRESTFPTEEASFETLEETSFQTLEESFPTQSFEQVEQTSEKNMEVSTENFENASSQTNSFTVSDIPKTTSTFEDLETPETQNTTLEEVALETSNFEAQNLETPNLQTSNFETSNLETSNFETSNFETSTFESFNTGNFSTPSSTFEDLDLQSATFQTNDESERSTQENFEPTEVIESDLLAMKTTELEQEITNNTSRDILSEDEVAAPHKKRFWFFGRKR
ncbi:PHOSPHOGLYCERATE KINASE [Mycoplasmopsis pulmonis]|uniref:Phosphoglycerate kinase n=1 Tax=Mycoplasmopsis pulmonis (strain UAB CTIP) TaxID=272635 RepID=PGK_MYCPU|nr:phosphoglycerate kinase [Mycoplasmopsis pulmonis]Q98QW4.1 RecName: Full=Phosphoglycerate kinase [Mycoplasmopsis pulmonis UAB CTIP]CAC13419.1 PHOSPHOGLYCERATE KINASE [Mycoplasmopsis pulmonis]